MIGDIIFEWVFQKIYIGNFTLRKYHGNFDFKFEKKSFKEVVDNLFVNILYNFNCKILSEYNAAHPFFIPVFWYELL
jgi:hypothetical protein